MLFEGRLGLDRENIFDKDAFGESQNSLANVTKRIIKTDGNGLKLSLLTLCFFMLLFGFLVLCTFPTVFFGTETAETVSLLEGFVYTLSSLALLVGIIFLILPSATGIMYYAMLSVFGLKPCFLYVVMPFGRGNYFRSIEVQLIVILRMLAIGLPLIGGLSYLPVVFAELSESSPFLMITESAFIICATLAATLVGAYFSSFLFFAPYLILAGKMKPFAALAESCRMSRARHAKIIKMSVRGLFDLLISALSLMVLYVLYAMPRMSVSYFVYCNSVIGYDDTLIDKFE